jgi:hypothetical protein
VFNGSSWTATQPTLPAALSTKNQLLDMGGISCAGSGPGSCAAVGSLEDAVPMAITN